MEQLTTIFYMITGIYVIFILILGLICLIPKKGLRRVIKILVNISFVIYSIFSFNVIVTLISEVWSTIIKIAT